MAIWWILGAAGAAVILKNLIDLWNSLTGRFQQNQAGPDFITRAACHEAHTKVEDKIDEFEKKLEAKHTELRNIISKDVAGAHKRIDQVLAAVSELKGEVKRIGR